MQEFFNWFGRIGSLPENDILKKPIQKKKTKCGTMAAKHVVTDAMNSCPAGLCPWRIMWRHSVLNFGSLNNWGQLLFLQFLLQRLFSCRLQCSFVQISRVSVGSLAVAPDNLWWSWTWFFLGSIRDIFSLCFKKLTFLWKKNKMDSVTLFYLCKVSIVNKRLSFLPVTKYNFYAINYIS